MAMFGKQGNHFAINIKKGQDIDIFLQRAAEIIYKEKGIVVYPSDRMYYLGFYPFYANNIRFVSNLFNEPGYIDNTQNEQNTNSYIKSLDIFVQNYNEIEKIAEINYLERNVIQKLWSDDLIIRLKLKKEYKDLLEKSKKDVLQNDNDEDFYENFYFDIHLNPNILIEDICKNISAFEGVGVVSAVPAVYLDDPVKTPVDGKKIIENYSQLANFILNTGKIKSGRKDTPKGQTITLTKVQIADVSESATPDYESSIRILRAGSLSKSAIIEMIKEK